MAFLASLIDFLLPPRASDQLVRSISLDDLFLLASPGRGTLPYHDPRITALIWELKYRANPHALSLAGQFLAEQLLAIASEELGVVVLVPVPMHENRRKKRGHNQTELLCKALLAHTSDVEYRPDILLRTLDTKPQQGLERHVRLKNVHNSMKVADPARVSGRVCVVVDDVTTTGATLDEAKRALLEAGARRVHFLPLAQS